MNVAIFATWHYGIILLIAVSAMAVGHELLRLIRPPNLTKPEYVCLACTLGLGSLSYVVMALGLVGLLSRGAIILCVAGPLLVGGWRAAAWLGSRSRHQGFRRALWKPGLILIVVGVAVAPLLAMALYPPTAGDATRCYLAGVKTYLINGAIAPTPYLRYPVYPQAVPMLYVVGMGLADDVVAQALQVLLAVLTGMALYSWARRAWSASAGWAALVMWAASPLVVFLAGVPYVDHGLTLFATLAVFSFWRAMLEKVEAWFVLSGVFAGLAASAKYSGLFFIAVLGLSAIVIAVRRRSPGAVAGFALAAFAVGSPWYLYTLYHSGNPTWPFFSAVFGTHGWWSPQDTAEVMRSLAANGIGRSLGAFLRAPWQVILHPERFQPFSVYSKAPLVIAYSKAFLVILPLGGVVAAKDRLVRWLLLLFGGFFVFWFFGAQSLRYLLPGVPIACVVAGSVWHRVEALLPPRGRIASPILRTTVLLLVLFPSWRDATQWISDQGPLPVNAGGRRAYLERVLPFYSAIEVANRDPGTLYCLFGSEAAYYCEGPFRGDWFGLAAYWKILPALASGESLFHTLASFGARYFLVAPGPMKVTMPTDAFFASAFMPLYGSEGGMLLYERVVPGSKRVVTVETLRNGSFEEDHQGAPDFWGRIGSPRMVGEAAHDGRMAVAVSGHEALFQFVKASGGQTFLLGEYVRSDEKGRSARLQVNWLDHAGGLIRVSAVPVNVTAQWRFHSMIVTAPERAKTAMVYLTGNRPNDTGIWFDALSFTRLIVENGVSAGDGRPPSSTAPP